MNQVDSPMEVDHLELPTLPVEVWHRIFNYLTYDELMNSALLVSKTWHAWILDSARFTTRTRLCLDKTKLRDWKVFRSSKRSYLDVDVHSMISRFVPPSLTFWKNLNQLYLRCSEFDGPNMLNLLRNCSLLKALAVKKCHVIDTDKVCEPVALKLTDLSLQNANESTDWIMDHLHCTEISNYFDVRGTLAPEWKADSIVKFLNRLEGNIKYLQIDDINLDNISAQITPTFAFKWQTFICKLYDIASTIDVSSPIMEQLCEASMAGSALQLSWLARNRPLNALRILELCLANGNVVSFECIGDFSGFQCSDFTVIGVFDKLVDLKIACYSIPSDESDVNAAFLSMFPNVQNLCLDLACDEFLSEISIAMMSSKFKNVTSLKILWDERPGKSLGVNELLKNINFPKRLESFMLGQIDNTETPEVTGELLSKLLKRHRKLTKIAFFDENNPNREAQRKIDFLNAISRHISGGSLSSLSVIQIESFCCSPLALNGMMGDITSKTIESKFII